jgi:hypothetical protein
MEEQKVTQQIYPSETIDLPSKGIFYPADSPLRSGQIEIYYMTAKHEDILTSTNLIQKGVVLDRLLDSLIATKGVKSADLLVGDLNAVMVAARILGYGKDYPITIDCPSCGEPIEQVADLTELATINEPNENDLSQFTIVLPISKAEVTLRLLTRSDELAIEKEVKSLKKASGEISGEGTARLRRIIKAVNGDEKPAVIWNFVENMLVRDARFLRDQYKEKIPDVDFDIDIDCSCGEVSDKKVRLPIGTDFFWPDTRV